MQRHTFSFIQHKSPKWDATRELATNFSYLDTWSQIYKTQIIPVHVIWDESVTNLQGRQYVGWTRSLLIGDTYFPFSISPF